MCFDCFRPQVCGRLATFVLGLAMLAAPGCGGRTDEPAGSAGSDAERSRSEGSRGQSREAENPGRSEASVGADDPAPGSDLARTDADGRKWIEDIPLDVWYDEPLVTYNDNVQTTAGGPASSAATART